jgi:hypothetical protein
MVQSCTPLTSAKDVTSVWEIEWQVSDLEAKEREGNTNDFMVHHYKPATVSVVHHADDRYTKMQSALSVRDCGKMQSLNTNPPTM